VPKKENCLYDNLRKEEENLRLERSIGPCIAGFEGRRHVVT
jgi:hypothetical protein